MIIMINTLASRNSALIWIYEYDSKYENDMNNVFMNNSNEWYSYLWHRKTLTCKNLTKCQKYDWTLLDVHQ